MVWHDLHLKDRRFVDAGTFETLERKGIKIWIYDLDILRNMYCCMGNAEEDEEIFLLIYEYLLKHQKAEMEDEKRRRKKEREEEKSILDDLLEGEE